MLFGLLFFPVLILVLILWPTRTPAQKERRAEEIFARRYPEEK